MAVEMKLRFLLAFILLISQYDLMINAKGGGGGGGRGSVSTGGSRPSSSGSSGSSVSTGSRPSSSSGSGGSRPSGTISSGSSGSSISRPSNTAFKPSNSGTRPSSTNFGTGSSVGSFPIGIGRGKIISSTSGKGTGISKGTVAAFAAGYATGKLSNRFRSGVNSRHYGIYHGYHYYWMGPRYYPGPGKDKIKCIVKTPTDFPFKYNDTGARVTELIFECRKGDSCCNESCCSEIKANTTMNITLPDTNWTVPTFPNPCIDPSLCGMGNETDVFICDPDAILPEQRRQVNNAFKNESRRQNLPMYVAIADSIPDLSQKYTDALLSNWSVECPKRGRPTPVALLVISVSFDWESGQEAYDEEMAANETYWVRPNIFSVYVPKTDEDSDESDEDSDEPSIGDRLINAVRGFNDYHDPMILARTDSPDRIWQGSGSHAGLSFMIMITCTLMYMILC